MNNKRILILHAPVGMGHPMVAKAIKDVFNEKYSDFEVKNINILDYTFKIFEKGLPGVYDYLSFRAPRLYKWAYHYYDDNYRQKFLNFGTKLFLNSKFIPSIKEFHPDFIIATHPLAMQLISLSKDAELINVLSANVCTDFGCHHLWFNRDIDFYFAANEEVRGCLAGYGAKNDSIKVTGIPIASKYAKTLERQKILEDLKLNHDQPILMIVGGQLSYGELLRVVGGIIEKNSRVQFIIVAGRDQILQKKFANSRLRSNQSVKLFGFVNNMDELMTAADLVFSKAGGSTVAECLAKCLPMIIYKVIPGQEEDNVNYLTRKGAAIKADGVKNLIKESLDLLDNKERLNNMKKSCQLIGRPKAAFDLADFVNYIIYK